MSESTPFPSPVIDAASQEAQSPDMPTFHHVNEFGKPVSLSEAQKTNAENSVTGFHNDLATELEGLPQRVEGLNLDKVQSFVEERGIEITPVHLINEEDMPAFGDAYRRSLESNNLGHLYKPADFDPSKNTRKGWHDAMSGRTFIVRDQLPEDENGKEAVEATIVHELFHAASSHGDLVIVHDDQGRVVKAVNPRIGLSLIDKRLQFGNDRRAGEYLEEAAATYFEAEYAAQNLPDEKVVLDAEVGKPEIPRKYARIENGRYRYRNGYQTSGYALGLMIEQKPELETAIIESRTSVEGLKNTAKIINEIQEGLYSALSRMDPLFFERENLEIVKFALGQSDSAESPGNFMLREPNNPAGVVKPGFVSRRDRVTHMAATRPEESKTKESREGRLRKIGRKALGIVR